MVARHVLIALAFFRRVAEVAPAFNHLLGRAAGDAKLQPPARNQVGGACILDHVERIFIAHVDDAGADLDSLGPGANGSEEREGRAKLVGEMVDAKVGAVGTKVFCGFSQLDGLRQHISSGTDGRAALIRPVAEGQKADLLHGGAFPENSC
ncbi:MAG: hypothetical protein FD150_1081 [Rhodobacteraceae bacterium]|nr:MAG: hypothetical protein FD150_1081 [Paracoccaceae bacterium]